MNAYMKIGASGGLFLLWAAAVKFGFADPDLILAIKTALISLGGWQAIAHLQTVPPEVNAAPTYQSAPVKGQAAPTVPLSEGPK
jgi:hypothetical protein